MKNVLGEDVAADLEAMARNWTPEAREALCRRAVRLAEAGMPPAAALLIAVGVLLDD
jgi:hypothetical protein